MVKYNPPIKPTTIQIPYAAMVRRADPDFERWKHREVEYEFAGRVFVADPYHAGSFNNNPNVYPVGQQQPR